MFRRPLVIRTWGSKDFMSDYACSYHQIKSGEHLQIKSIIDLATWCGMKWSARIGEWGTAPSFLNVLNVQPNNLIGYKASSVTPEGDVQYMTGVEKVVVGTVRLNKVGWFHLSWQVWRWFDLPCSRVESNRPSHQTLISDHMDIQGIIIASLICGWCAMAPNVL